MTEQLNKIRVASTEIGIDEEASARLYLNTVLDLCTFGVLFLVY